MLFKEISYNIIDGSLLSFGELQTIGQGFLVPILYDGKDLVITHESAPYVKFTEKNFYKTSLRITINPNHPIAKKMDKVADFINEAVVGGQYGKYIKGISERCVLITKVKKFDGDEKVLYVTLSNSSSAFDLKGELLGSGNNIPTKGTAYVAIHIKSIFISKKTISLQTPLYQMAVTDKQVK